MKNPNLALIPTVIGFGKSPLEKRIISIMKFKKPTALTTALSAFLVIGIGSTAAFAVTAPEVKESNTVPNPLPAVTASEPVITSNESGSTPSKSDITISKPGDEYKIIDNLFENNKFSRSSKAYQNASNAYSRFINSLGENFKIYPDSYAGAYIDKNCDLIFQVTTDDHSEYQFLQDEFPCVKFRKAENSINYLKSLAEKYLMECADIDTWYTTVIDNNTNSVYVLCDEKTAKFRLNDPEYSQIKFELGDGCPKFMASDALLSYESYNILSNIEYIYIPVLHDYDGNGSFSYATDPKGNRVQCFIPREWNPKDFTSIEITSEYVIYRKYVEPQWIAEHYHEVMLDF